MKKESHHHETISASVVFKKIITMKRSHASLFLLLISCLIPLNLAYLYQDFYEDIDFLPRKHFTVQDEENFVTVLKKNPRAFNGPVPSADHSIMFLPEISLLQVFSVLFPQKLKPFVLRC
jgi:hypothetical protein